MHWRAVSASSAGSPHATRLRVLTTRACGVGHRIGHACTSMLLHDGGSVSVLRLPLVLRCAVNTASLTPVSLHAPRAQLQHVYVPRFHLAASAGALVRLQRQRLACQDSQRAGQGISSPSLGSRLWSGSATLTAARGLEVNHAVLPLWKHATRLLLQPPILARRQRVLHHVPRPAIPCFSSSLSTLLSKPTLKFSKL